MSEINEEDKRVYALLDKKAKINKFLEKTLFKYEN